MCLRRQGTGASPCVPNIRRIPRRPLRTTMPMDNGKTVRRVLQFKFTLPTTEPTQFLAFIRAAEPYYELFGGKEVRLLQNVDQPAQFIQIIDYEVHESLESNRQQIAGDPRLQA